jgi:hypothetical protein
MNDQPSPAAMRAAEHINGMTQFGGHYGTIAMARSIDAEFAKAIEALKFYAGAPWVGHAGSWAHSNLAKRASDALHKLGIPDE